MTKPKSEKRFVNNQNPGFNMTQNYSDKNLAEVRKPETMKKQNSDSTIGVVNYKTKICRHFETGKCKLSGLCNFAHGQEELAFYQKMGKIDDKGLKTLEKYSHFKAETSIQKIEKMECLLDAFYYQQRRMLEQLKNMTLNIKSGLLKNEENISQMEANIFNVYNSAVDYTREIGKTMDIINNPAKVSEPASCEKKTNRYEGKVKSAPFTDLVEELDENQLELVKNQISYIIVNLERLPWKPKSEQTSRLYDARYAYENNQLLEASKHLQVVLYDKNLDPILAQACKRIVQETMSWRV